MPRRCARCKSSAWNRVVQDPRAQTKRKTRMVSAPRYVDVPTESPGDPQPREDFPLQANTPAEARTAVQELVSAAEVAGTAPVQSVKRITLTVPSKNERQQSGPQA